MPSSHLVTGGYCATRARYLAGGERSANWCGFAQVPYTLVDEDIPDDWSCADNVWDPGHRSCDVPQALSDERIDEILLQQVQLEVCCQPLS